MLFSLTGGVPNMGHRRGDADSPTWSVYDDCWSGTAPEAELEELVPPQPHGDTDSSGKSKHGATEQRARRLPFISFPEPPATLKGSGLKKEAPIRRGAQGAVYAARDPHCTTPTAFPSNGKPSLTSTASPISRHSDPVSLFMTNATAPRVLPSRGRPVAVKRIFIQSNDFGARDLAATVLREVTLHRFITDTQAATLALTRRPQQEEHQPATALTSIDASVRVVQLERVVEAPHKEMCLVMERAATSLERVVLPYGPRGAPHTNSTGGYKRKTGMVSLFGGAAELAARDGEPTSASPVEELPMTRYLMRRLLRVVCFLHETCGVVHRDLKLSNVLVMEDGGLRLGDFGSARFLPPAPPPHPGTPAWRREALLCTPPSMRTTLHYRPPEVLLGDQACRPAADVWALGVIFAQLLLRKGLFFAESELDLLGAIQKLLGGATCGEPPAWPPAVPFPTASQAPLQEQEVEEDGDVDARRAAAPPPTVASLPYKFHSGVVPADGLDLLSRMLEQQPEQRITVRAALQHPFLRCRAADDEQAEANSASEEEEDDARGRVMWQEKVAEALCNHVTALGTGAGGAERRPVFMGLGLGDGSSDDDDDSDDGVEPFRVNLGGGYTSS